VKKFEGYLKDRVRLNCVALAVELLHLPDKPAGVAEK